MKRLLSLTLLLTSLAACTGDDDGNGFNAKLLYGPTNKEVVVEVDYQAGAEPYFTTDFADVPDPWTTFFASNVKNLFSKYERTYTIPGTLAQMQSINDITAADFTTDDIHAIESKNRNEHSTDGRSTFYVVFLNGYFKDDTGVQKDVMGVTIGTGGLTAIFKPVVRDVASICITNSLSDTQCKNGTIVDAKPFAEQTTLVHEFGHAAGLVNRGVKATTDHQDTANGAHCKVSTCVMYYLNEGPKDLIEFIKRTRMMSGNIPSLYGQECLDDAHNADN